MYYYFDQPSVGAETIRQIVIPLPGGGVQSVPDVDSNSGPERAAFLEWVAAGGIPEPWNGA